MSAESRANHDEVKLTEDQQLSQIIVTINRLLKQADRTSLLQWLEDNGAIPQSEEFLPHTLIAAREKMMLQACLGSTEAISALHATAVRISEFLYSLLAETDNSTAPTNQSEPTKLIVEELKEAIYQLQDYSPEKVTEAVNALKNKGSSLVFIPLPMDFMSNMADLERPTHSTLIHQKLLQSLLEMRFATEAKRATQALLQDSSQWPVSIRKEGDSFLPNSEQLQLRLSKMEEGSPPSVFARELSLHHESPLGLAARIFDTLDTYRTYCIGYSDEQFDRLRRRLLTLKLSDKYWISRDEESLDNTAEQLEGLLYPIYWLKSTKSLEQAEPIQDAELIRVSPLNKETKLSNATKLRIHLLKAETMAMLLPAFSPSSLNDWLEAASAYTEYQACREWCHRNPDRAPRLNSDTALAEFNPFGKVDLARKIKDGFAQLSKKAQRG